MADGIAIGVDPESIREEWSQLADSVSQTPFDHPGWITTWHDCFGSARLELITCRTAGLLVGVLPVERRGGVVRSPTNWHSCQFAPLAREPAVQQRLLAAACEQARGRLDLAFVDRNSGVADEIRSAPVQSVGFVERVIESSPYLPLEGSWDQFVDALPSRKRRKLLQSRDGIAQLGEVRLRTSLGEEELEADLATGFTIEGSGWKGENGTAIISRDATRRFYEGIARWASAKGWLRLQFLELDGEPIAFGFGLDDLRAEYDLKNGFDPRFGEHGPGYLLMAARLERCFGLGLERFEFLGAAERHKLTWTDECHVKTRVQLFRSGIQGRVEHLAWTKGRSIVQRLRNKLDR